VQQIKFKFGPEETVIIAVALVLLLALFQFCISKNDSKVKITTMTDEGDDLEMRKNKGMTDPHDNRHDDENDGMDDEGTWR